MLPLTLLICEPHPVGMRGFEYAWWWLREVLLAAVFQLPRILSNSSATRSARLPRSLLTSYLIKRSKLLLTASRAPMSRHASRYIDANEKYGQVTMCRSF